MGAILRERNFFMNVAPAKLKTAISQSLLIAGRLKPEIN